MGSDVRNDLARLFRRYFSPDTGATEAMMALFGAFLTVREINAPEPSDRAKRGVNEMLYSFTVGLPLGNPFWQRTSVALFPVLAAAQLELVLAAEYIADERKHPTDSPEATALRRKAAQCMSGYYTLAFVALVADRGLEFATSKARVLRDELATLLES